MIDCHVHLDDPRYDGERKEIISNFAADGIDFVINSSSDVASMNAGAALAEKYEKIYATVGLHPSCADEFNDAAIERIKELAEKPKIVAMGEIGLDYHYPDTQKQLQKDVFAAQIELADGLGLPLVLHIRDAWGDALDILKAQNRFLNSGVMFHCYSASVETTKLLAQRDWYFSVGGSLTYMAKKRYAMLAEIPLGQIVTETDGPYLAPEPYRGRLNYPKYIRFVLPLLADAYGLTTEQTEAQVEYNAKKYFKKIK